MKLTRVLEGLLYQFYKDFCKRAIAFWCLGGLVRCPAGHSKLRRSEAFRIIPNTQEYSATNNGGLRNIDF